jgi:hypothetical protein
MLRGNLKPILNRRILLLNGALVAPSPAMTATGASSGSRGENNQDCRFENGLHLWSPP